MIQPIDNMGTDNVPTRILNTIGDKSVQLDADALRLNIDLLGLPKNVIIDGTSFTRYNTATGITYTASWDTLHLRLLHTIAVQPNPNSTTMSVNDTLNLTTGIARNFDLKMNGTNAEATSTGQLLLQSADTMNLTTTGVANMNLTSAGGSITTNGATIDMGAGRTIEQASITGVSGVPLEIVANPTGNSDIILTTNTDQDTTQDSQGNIKQTNKQGLNNFPVGSLYTAGIRGRQLLTTGGGAGYGDFITYGFIVGQMNDGRGHNLTRGIGLNTGFEVFDWGASPGMIQSFSCRMVGTLPDANTFICPVILADLPSGIPDINYNRITYYGNQFTNPIWVNEGGAGVQCPAVQVNRFYGGSQVIVEWSCSFVINNAVSQTLSPLNYKVKIIGIDSSQEVLRAEAVVNWLDHPLPQATALRPCLVFENGVGAWNSIESAEMWANGSPFGI